MKNVQITKITENKIKPRIKRRKTGGNGMGAIQLKNVTKKIRGVTVLDNVSIRMESGNIYGFKGKNGSGKTMLMELLILMGK